MGCQALSHYKVRLGLRNLISGIFIGCGNSLPKPNFAVARTGRIYGKASVRLASSQLTFPVSPFFFFIIQREIFEGFGFRLRL